jgi:Fe-S-cluster containining protein
MTEDDYDRISEVDWGARLPQFANRKLYRSLRPHEKKGTPYVQAILEGDDGRCPFLVNNLCFIHSQFESKTKPSICQLFPYCFNETPSGVYATVSFVSMGVIHNSGKALIEQREYLEQKLNEFKTLFPDSHPNWSKLEIVGGKPITWERYLEIEKQMITRLQNFDQPMEERLKNISRFLVQLTRDSAPSAASNATAATSTSSSTASAGSPAGVQTAAEETAQGAAVGPLKPLDNHLLMALHSIYFPTKVLAPGERDFQVGRFIMQILLKGMGSPLRLAVPGKSYTAADLAEIAWSENEPEVDNLLYRYIFSRIFGKLYFSAGFGQLTLVTGFHHLVMLYALLKWQAKAICKSRGASHVTYLDVVAAVRQLEKRLGETALGGYGAATYELLMFSPGRAQRVLQAVS